MATVITQYFTFYLVCALKIMRRFVAFLPSNSNKYDENTLPQKKHEINHVRLKVLEREFNAVYYLHCSNIFTLHLTERNPMTCIQSYFSIKHLKISQIFVLLQKSQNDFPKNNFYLPTIKTCGGLFTIVGILPNLITYAIPSNVFLNILHLPAFNFKIQHSFRFRWNGVISLITA